MSIFGQVIAEGVATEIKDAIDKELKEISLIQDSELGHAAIDALIRIRRNCESIIEAAKTGWY